jgi:hypothetical protein
MKLFTCQFCGKETTNAGGHAKHVKHCHSNPNYVKAYRSPKAGQQKGCKPWNLGKELSEKQKQKISKALIGKSKGIASTPEKEIERIKKITEYAKLNNGGLRKGSGRGKKGKYKGYWCDSSWELAFVIYNLDHGIEFKRNTKGFDYEFEGKSRKYFPDFIIEDCYYEIKGYITKQSLEKINSFNFNIKVIDKNEIQKYLSYVENKYGKDFVRLYGE